MVMSNQPVNEGALNFIGTDHWGEPEAEDIRPMLHAAFPSLYRPPSNDLAPAAPRIDYQQVPALLTDPSSCGTLAAARYLGKRGVPVWTTASDNGAPTAHSRYVTQHLRCAKTSEAAGQIAWLTEFGRHHPGTVLYPTSDDSAWMVSANLLELERYFRTYSPDIDALENVLDKRRLFEACCAVGIDSPTSYFAESIADVEAVVQRAQFPLLLKQRTQIFSKTKTKGALVRRPEQLLDSYQRFTAANPHAPEVAARMPFASWPLMQSFHPEAHKGSYLVSGFVNRDHTEMVAQAAVKVLQYPRTLGIALCMEQAPLDTQLATRILALCKKTGHFGVFQIEFLVDGDRKLLIDFNPRYYHYMAFDIARGLPLPWFSHLGACGDERELAIQLREARRRKGNLESVFSYRLQLAELLWSQRLTGTMSAADFRHWRLWYRRHRDHIVDAVADAGDRWPEITVGVAKWLSHLRHPRAFVRCIALDR
jgi:predicted ATP-grasp superfamily ATP-dependent carboligase